MNIVIDIEKEVENIVNEAQEYYDGLIKYVKEYPEKGEIHTLLGSITNGKWDVEPVSPSSINNKEFKQLEEKLRNDIIACIVKAFHTIKKDFVYYSNKSKIDVDETELKMTKELFNKIYNVTEKHTKVVD